MNIITSLFKISLNKWCLFKLLSSKLRLFKLLPGKWCLFKLVPSKWYLFKLVPGKWCLFKLLHNKCWLFIHSSTICVFLNFVRDAKSLNANQLASGYKKARLNTHLGGWGRKTARKQSSIIKCSSSKEQEVTSLLPHSIKQYFLIFQHTIHLSKVC